MPSYPDHLWSTLTTISAAVSILGSSAMLYAIFKSRDKLKTTLHRLLFCLCVADIMMSIAVMLLKAVVKFQDRLGPDGEVMSSFPVATNQAACNAQGFFSLVGGTLSPFYNCSLCVYYLFVIKFNYSDTKIKKKVEPFLHAVPWTWALFCAFYGLVIKAFNPSFTSCAINHSPFDCLENDDVDCERGRSVDILNGVVLIPFISCFFVMCYIMAVLYWTVRKQERRMERYDHRRIAAASLASRGDGASMIALSISQRQHGNSRNVLNQALAYVGAFLCSYTFVYIHAFIFLSGGEYNDVLQLLQNFFHPLQGFFNFLVFIYPKVTRQLRGNDDMNVLQALLAAVRCKPLPPRRNGNLRGNAAGRVGANSGSRNISGLRGTPSTYNVSHSSGAANRSGQRAITTTSSTAAASSMLVSNTSYNGLDTTPDEKKVSFARECIADQATTRSYRSHPPGSILRNSHLTASSSLKALVEDDIGILPERKLAVDGSTALELIPGGYIEASERD